MDNWRAEDVLRTQDGEVVEKKKYVKPAVQEDAQLPAARASAFTLDTTDL